MRKKSSVIQSSTVETNAVRGLVFQQSLHSPGINISTKYPSLVVGKISSSERRTEEEEHRVSHQNMQPGFYCYLEGKFCGQLLPQSKKGSRTSQSGDFWVSWDESV